MAYQDISLSPLGKKVPNINTYTPSLLFPIDRSNKRKELGITDHTLPFQGYDVWNLYELSWLNPKGKPEICLGQLLFPCSSPCLVEAKSLKLYLNSFNQSPFSSREEVRQTIQKDLSQATGSPVEVQFHFPKELHLTDLTGTCLDTQDIQIDTYNIQPDFLKTIPKQTQETLYSHLLKSNCLMTGQPDWGSVIISYKGSQIDHEGLLKYIISFRNHIEFNEHCIERIFVDVLRRCQPKELTVYGRYTRRGGMDTNPFRSTLSLKPNNVRNPRQ